MSDKRNGKIDFMRMVFCLIVVVFHIYCDVPELAPKAGATFSFFMRGSISVEFFFLVSGYLLAASAYKNSANGLPVGKDNALFMYRKLTAILPYHLVAFAVTYITRVCYGEHTLKAAVMTFVNALPNLFLIQQTGIMSSNLLSVEWYISAMLLSMAVIYPLCRRNYDFFARAAAPVIGVFTVGSVSYIYKSLVGTSVWSGIVSKTILRAIAEICLGVFAFEVVRYLKKQEIARKWRVVLTVVEVSCYAATLFYIVSTLSIRYDTYVLYALMVAVSLSFSGITYGARLFNNRFMYFLGRFSLPVYLSQSAVRNIVNTGFADLDASAHTVLTFVLTFALAVPVMYIGDFIKKRLPQLK